MAALLNAEDLEKKQIFLVLALPVNLRKRNIELIREISSQGYITVVITTNFPYSVLSKLYTESGIDPTMVSFIDTVTQNSIGDVEDIPRVVRFINSPANLTDMGIAIIEVLKENSGQKVCILFDSVSTMLIYLSSPDISKFMHFITNKLRLMDISGIFLAAEKGLDPKFRSQLTTLVDKVIDSG